MTLARHKQHLLRSLASKVETGHVTQLQIARETGVHQSQISRILSGNTKRLSKNVEIVCNYAESTIAPASIGGNIARRALTAAILDIWDGTQRHADVLEDAIRAIGESQRVFSARK